MEKELEELSPSIVNSEGQGGKIKFKRVIDKVINNWYWFIICVIIAWLCAYVYLARTANVYKGNALIMVIDNNGGGAMNVTSKIGDLGDLVSTRSNVNNELLILKSRDLMYKVIRELHLNNIYYIRTRFGLQEKYSKTPFKVYYSDSAVIQSYFAYKLFYLGGDKVKIVFDNGQNNSKEEIVHFGDSIYNSSIGSFTIQPTGQPFSKTDEYYFGINPYLSVALAYMSGLSVGITDKSASGIGLTYTSNDAEKDEAVLNVLIKEYIKGNLSVKNEYADSTIQFINARVNIVDDDLHSVENELKDFKEKNGSVELSSQAQLFVTNSNIALNNLNETEVKLNIVRVMLDYVMDEKNNKRPVPVLMASGDPTFSGLLSAYNSLQGQIVQLGMYNTKDNPGMKQLEDQLQVARVDLIHNLRNIIVALNIDKKHAQAQMDLNKNLLSGVPNKELNFLTLQRQQKLKEAIYIFLLQRREEMAIAKASNMANARVIDAPLASRGPIAPNRMQIYVVAILFGLVLPYGIIVLLEFIDDKIRSEEDITDKYMIPVLGKIFHSDDPEPIMFRDSSRDVQAELFRNLRANLQFIIGASNKKSNVLLVTSSMAGEGKSYLSINVARAFASLNKKVLIIELDLRKPKLKSTLGYTDVQNGISTYLTRQDVAIEDCIRTTDDAYLDIIFSGPTPPNPAELMQSEKLKELVSTLSSRYELIIFDTAPVGVVSDAKLLMPMADVTLYVVRENTTFKDQLQIAADLIESKKTRALYFVLNDDRIQLASKYGYSRYGYSYGYGYGYGSYINGVKPSNSLLSKIRKLFKTNKK